MSNKDKLNEKQENAIELILKGMNDSEIAERVGVSRQWVNTWRNHDEDFMEALQMRRKMLQEVHMNQLEELVAEAISVVREALRDASQATRLKAAMYILKLSGLQGYAKPVVETKEDKAMNALQQALDELAEEMGFD